MGKINKIEVNGVVYEFGGEDGKDGKDGKDFTYEDFTPEQLEALKGKDFKYEDFTAEQLTALKGESFKYEDFTAEQLEALKGEKGDAFTYSDFTPEQLAALKGEPFKYEDFTDEQLESLGSGGSSSTVYSTAEVAIGTWVDGSTIYRKSFDYAPTNGNMPAFSCKKVINFYGSFLKSGAFYSLSHNGNGIVCSVRFIASKIYAACTCTTNTSQAVLYLTVEYTK